MEPLFSVRQDITSRAACKYSISSMVSLYVSTSGLVPACKHNINSMVSLYMLVLVAWFLLLQIIIIISMVSLLLELGSCSFQECN